MITGAITAGKKLCKWRSRLCLSCRSYKVKFLGGDRTIISQNKTQNGYCQFWPPRIWPQIAVLTLGFAIRSTEDNGESVSTRFMITSKSNRAHKSPYRGNRPSRWSICGIQEDLSDCMMVKCVACAGIATRYLRQLLKRIAGK